MDDGRKNGPGPNSGAEPGDEEKMEDHEAERAADEAELELRQEMGRLTEREYQKMAADLRWEALEYIDAHPERSAVEVGEFFGLREGTIRAWKAHRTMGTYRGPAPVGAKNGALSKPRQENLFREPKPTKPPPFFERKRFSHFIHFFDKTPPGIVCPHFYILAHANGCPYSCAYCYLRLTLRHYPEPTVFSNTARMFQEMRDWLLSREEPSVLNAGELSDALAWDQQTMLTSNLVPLFQNQNRHKLLLLTKSTSIENLLKLEPTPQVIVSFSINATPVSALYEPGSPPPEARLAAAKKLSKAGWEVRLRLDPLIPIEGWQNAYQDIISRINEVEPKIVTIGSLRYFRNLVSHAPPGTDVFSFGVDHNDPDGRLRIPLELREQMYKFCLDRIKCLRIGLCKETSAMHRSLGLLGQSQSCNCTIG